MTTDPSVMRALVTPSGQPASVPMRARRWGEVPSEQQRELRARLGTRLWTERASAGITQRQLAERGRAAHLGLQLAKLGLDISTARSAAVAKQARQMAALAQALCEEVGLDWADDATRRIAQRALPTPMSARSEEGARK